MFFFYISMSLVVLGPIIHIIFILLWFGVYLFCAVSIREIFAYVMQMGSVRFIGWINIWLPLVIKTGTRVSDILWKMWHFCLIRCCHMNLSIWIKLDCFLKCVHVSYNVKGSIQLNRSFLDILNTQRLFI